MAVWSIQFVSCKLADVIQLSRQKKKEKDFCKDSFATWENENRYNEREGLIGITNQRKLYRKVE